MTKPLNAFTAPATVRFARHEQAQITRDPGRAYKSICITPLIHTQAERGARIALFESRQDVVEQFKRVLNTR